MKKLARSAIAAMILGIVSQPALSLSSPEILCPTDYRPTVCSYEEFSVEGTNRCWAFIGLTNLLKSNAVDYDPSLIRCKSSEIQAQRFVKPTCGIVPTTTSCSIAVNSLELQETTEDCASPIPGLKRQLTAAGVDQQSGLIVSCIRSQLAEESRYQVAL